MLTAKESISARTGKHVSSETKTVMCNIYNYFNELSSKGGIAISSPSCIVIIHEKIQLAKGKEFATLTKHYCCSQKRI